MKKPRRKREKELKAKRNPGTSQEKQRERERDLKEKNYVEKVDWCVGGKSKLSYGYPYHSLCTFTIE